MVAGGWWEKHFNGDAMGEHPFMGRRPSDREGHVKAVHVQRKPT